MSSTPQYTLTMRQEPKHSRFCTSPTDRRPIDPPPIIQLQIGGDDDDAWRLLQNPHFVMFVSLTRPDMTDELHWLHTEDADGTARPPTRYTTGSVVSSLHILKDPENGQRRGGFFVFPDLGVRAEGRYRLKCTMYELIDGLTFYRGHLFSSVFEVYQSRKFPGMQKSTLLSSSFSEQGIKIWIRKNVRERRAGSTVERSKRLPETKQKRPKTDEGVKIEPVLDQLKDLMSPPRPPLPVAQLSYAPPIVADAFPLPPGHSPDHLHYHRPLTGRSRMSIGNLLNASDSS